MKIGQPNPKGWRFKSVSGDFLQMEFKKFENKYVIRLYKDEKIIETLLKFLRDNHIKLGYFFGLGALHRVELAHYALKTKKYSSKVLEGAFEIASLHGNIATLNGEEYIHAHIVVSDDEMNTFGGHLKEAVVGPTCEIILVEIDGEVEREFSGEIGLNLFKF